jgi:hypothetical protein
VGSDGAPGRPLATRGPVIRRLLARARRALSRRVHTDPAEAVSRAGLVPIDQVAPEDVFVVGYPKSGNTWTQVLLAGALYGLRAELTPDLLIQDLVPDVHYLTHYKRYRTPTFFKSHNLPMPKYRRVIYLLRDGRDAMVSCYHHLCALQAVPPDFLEMVQKGEGLFPCKWHEHVEQWLANPYSAAMMVVRYEEMRHDTVAALRRMCEFAGVERDSETLGEAVNRASFESMREKERTQGWANPAWPKEKPFVRRGEVGSYKEEMPAAVLEAFLQEADETLGKAGYLSSWAAARARPLGTWP